jgi:hypothetical protein
MQTQVVNQGEGTAIRLSTIPGQTEIILRISVVPSTVSEVENTVEVPTKRITSKMRHVAEKKPIEQKHADEKRNVSKRSVMIQPRSTPIKRNVPEKKEVSVINQVSAPTVTRIKLRAPGKVDHYLGKIGDRKVFDLVLQEQKQDRVGTTSRWTYLFREEKTGKTAIWITYRDHRLVNGQTYHLHASIKKFYDRRGVKSTLITRGKIVESEE